MAAIRKILVVDHLPEERERAVTELARLGYQAAAVASAEEALQAIPHERPDLVLLDVEMPDQDGYLVCAKVKRFSQNRIEQIPVVLCSVNASEKDKHLGKYAGCDEYILKPIDWGKLAGRLDDLMQKDCPPTES
jgi:two-component system KDP operon response regulator KdpE